MAGMKVTLNAAMRARDVSRPRPGHVADAAAPDEAACEPAVAERSVPAPAEDTPAPRARRRRRRAR